MVRVSSKVVCCRAGDLAGLAGACHVPWRRRRQPGPCRAGWSLGPAWSLPFTCSPWGSCPGRPERSLARGHGGQHDPGAPVRRHRQQRQTRPGGPSRRHVPRLRACAEDDAQLSLHGQSAPGPRHPGRDQAQGRRRRCHSHRAAADPKTNLWVQQRHST